MKKNTKKSNGIGIIFDSSGRYVQTNFVKLISFFLTFLVVVFLSFARICVTNTIANYNLADYEVGQIADMTVIASKSLPADSSNPVSVEKGEKVIKKGFAISEEGYAKLKRMAESRAYIDFRAFANTVLYLMLLSALYFFMFGKVCLRKNCSSQEYITSNIFFLFIFATVILAYRTVFFSGPYSVNVVLPSVFCTFLMAILFGQMDAICFAFISSFGILCASGYQLVPFLYNLCVTLAASRIVKRIDKRIDLVFASLLQGFLSVVFIFVFKIIFNDSMSDGLFTIGGCMFNGFLSGILCLGFLTPLEYLLNSASVFRLMDLSDTNAAVLKKMSVNASGTFNHSIMVAQLAESACDKIGANALLARVSGYYHDVGKIENPEYFTENQVNGENIHNELNPSLSVTIIKKHVKRGIEIAKELHLPQQIVDIIAEHHGNSVLRYFYETAKKDGSEVNPADYSYDGNPPSTRESAVVMLADIVEAACKSLENPSSSRLKKFIQQLIANKINEHQLDDCDLSFKDISVIEDEFTNILTGYYHSRVKYPDQKDPDTGEIVEASLGEKTLDQVRPVVKEENQEEEDSSAAKTKTAAAKRGKKVAK